MMFLFWVIIISPVNAETIREDRQDLRKNIRELKKDGLNPTEIRTTLAPTISQIRQEVKERNQSLLDKVKNKIKEMKYGAHVNGTVNNISESTLTVTDKDQKSYTVYITDKTKLKRRFWGESNLSEFSVGNTVNVIGTWKDEGKTQIDAIMIRNTSIQKVNGTFMGTITSKSETGFVISNLKRETQTVNLNNSSRIINRIEGIISLADLQVGHRVRVKGLWDRTLKTISEVSQVKDFSLPPLPTKAALPTATQ